MSGSKIPTLVHEKDLARLVTLSARRLRQLADEGKFPKPKEAFYKFWPAVQGIIRFYSERPAPARERLTKAQASREERKDRMESGEDIHSDIVRRGWSDVCLLFRQRMLAVGNNVQSKSGITEPQRAAIEQEIADGLRELDKRIHYAAELKDDEATLAALKPQ